MKWLKSSSFVTKRVIKPKYRQEQNNHTSSGCNSCVWRLLRVQGLTPFAREQLNCFFCFSLLQSASNVSIVPTNCFVHFPLQFTVGLVLSFQCPQSNVCSVQCSMSSFQSFLVQHDKQTRGWTKHELLHLQKHHSKAKINSAFIPCATYIKQTCKTK